MDSKYQEWIQKTYPIPKDVLGKCRECAEAMAKQFPELSVTCGFIYLLFSDEPRDHWWCKTADGEIVDPSGHQFKAFNTSIAGYEEVPKDHPARLYKKSKCMNCGEYYYVTPDNPYMHNEKCHKEFVDWMEGPGD